MKKLISSLIVAGITLPIPVLAQQTNLYQVCTTYAENYSPGYYDSNGNYRQGNVNTQSYNTQCGTGTYYRPNNAVAAPYYAAPVVVQPAPQPYYRQRVCNPTAGALMGAGLASALSGGGGWSNSGKWNRYYGRRYSAGSWSNSYRNNSGWTLFGAGLGALAFSC
jgi:hypothetical protein